MSKYSAVGYKTGTGLSITKVVVNLNFFCQIRKQGTVKLQSRSMSRLVKFMYSEKVKSTMDILQNFVAFLECMNFILVDSYLSPIFNIFLTKERS